MRVASINSVSTKFSAKSSANYQAPKTFHKSCFPAQEDKEHCTVGTVLSRGPCKGIDQMLRSASRDDVGSYSMLTRRDEREVLRGPGGSKRSHSCQ